MFGGQRLCYGVFVLSMRIAFVLAAGDNAETIKGLEAAYDGIFAAPISDSGTVESDSPASVLHSHLEALSLQSLLHLARSMGFSDNMLRSFLEFPDPEAGIRDLIEKTLLGAQGQKQVDPVDAEQREVVLSAWNAHLAKLPNFSIDGRVTSTPDLNLLGVGTNSETASPLSTSTTAFSSNAPALMTLAHSATLRGGLAKKQFPMSSPAQGRHTVEKSDARAERYAKPALATPLFVTIVMIACICLAAPVCFFARRRKGSLREVLELCAILSVPSS